MFACMIPIILKHYGLIARVSTKKFYHKFTQRELIIYRRCIPSPQKKKRHTVLFCMFSTLSIHYTSKTAFDVLTILSMLIQPSNKRSCHLTFLQFLHFPFPNILRSSISDLTWDQNQDSL